jgi:Tol biopolymer transport system component
MNSILRPGLCSMVALLFLIALAAGAQGDGASNNPSISANGRYVAFESAATNLVAGDANGMSDVFVRDRQMGTTTLVSRNSAGVEGDYHSYIPSISTDGRYVAFDSDAPNLVSGDTNAMRDIFVRDRQTGTTTRVSKSSAGTEANYGSFDSIISADGRYVAFDSDATTLVAGDTNGFTDVFMRDRQTGTTSRVSRDSAGLEGDENSYTPSLSADGRYVAFESLATNLVAGDTNTKRDIFVRDRQTGTTTLISKSSAGVQGNGNSFSPSFSDNGRYVTFVSASTNLVSVPTSGADHIYVRDRQTGTTYMVSKSTAGVEGDSGSSDPMISADGRYVTFMSYAANLVTGDTNSKSDVFVRDRQTGITTFVSKSSAGVPGDGYSYHPSISSDGRYVAFDSSGTNLVAADTNAVSDVFVRDRNTGTTWLVSKS